MELNNVELSSVKLRDLFPSFESFRNNPCLGFRSSDSNFFVKLETNQTSLTSTLLNFIFRRRADHFKLFKSFLNGFRSKEL